MGGWGERVRENSEGGRGWGKVWGGEKKRD